MEPVTLAPRVWTEVQGYELMHTAPDGRTVTVDDQGAVHLPALDAQFRWAVRDGDALAPLTVDPDPVEDPAGRFELVDGA